MCCGSFNVSGFIFIWASIRLDSIESLVLPLPKALEDV